MIYGFGMGEQDYGTVDGVILGIVLTSLARNGAFTQ
jgi:hypothetical protein